MIAYVTVPGYDFDPQSLEDYLREQLPSDFHVEWYWDDLPDGYTEYGVKIVSHSYCGPHFIEHVNDAVRYANGTMVEFVTG